MYAVSAALSRFLAVFLHHLFTQERSRRRRVGDGGNGGGSVLQAVSNVDTTAALNVLDEFMDALKEARPDVYNDLVHSLRRK